MDDSNDQKCICGEWMKEIPPDQTATAVDHSRTYKCSKCGTWRVIASSSVASEQDIVTEWQ